MIKITKRAIQQLQRILREDKSAPAGLRIGFRGNGKCVLNYFVAVEKKSLPEDEIFNIEGLSLFVDKKSMTILRDIELDYFEGIDRSGFIFRTYSLEKRFSGPHCD